MAYTRLALIMGDCLFPDHQELHPQEDTLFFMAEDYGLCTYFKYHKQKLVLFLSAMRSHGEELAQKYPLVYHRLSDKGDSKSYEEKLTQTLKAQPQIQELVTYQVEDRFMEKLLRQWCEEHNIHFRQVDSPKFLFPLSDFEAYLKEYKKPFQHTYYQRQRRALDILMEEDGSPLYGQWSFDADNRKKLPQKISLPELQAAELTQNDREVIDLVHKLFEDHPGSTENFGWATTRKEALRQLKDFIQQRLDQFGPYEDALEKEYTFLYHSTLSPYLNMGLLRPREVLEAALNRHYKQEVHYPSLEGFVRQIIGWREFLRGMYHFRDLEGNYFGHQRKLSSGWYTGETGIPPLDDTIRKAQRQGYTHHIERLMVAGNIMLMAELDPKEVYRWFMEMYVDSADWVMVPNVFGMSQFADGGTFATKPYISGSNYIRKMSHYPKGDWCDIVDGLYWRYIDRFKDTFGANARMGMMLASLRKMDASKKDRIFSAAEQWMKKMTVPA